MSDSRPAPATLDGPRLRLRPWRDDDREAFAAMNADPIVMRYFAAPLARAESDLFLTRLQDHFATHGFGFWALELHGRPGLVGLCGLARISWDHIPWENPADPPVEIGWRLNPAFHRLGLAEEAARIALAHGFGPRGLPEIVAFTVPDNVRSWGLMERLTMRRAGGFEHPRLPEGHPKRHQLLYRLRRQDWIDGRIP
ncbi:GNAT family N-acetyltransferase [Pseudoroseomonas deserti]|uniref:GNAT family N-acetyltransferase n=1 Tax=Teichococcus deserti TaxID=1817963 RepID=A0A1V2GXD0_9PROT|nr:GNAT family protein [Pseudoroseomonas deserti]ONG47371.1 GNAT family N-acetyltransferase [Pseudoroseomonas deserti]